MSESERRALGVAIETNRRSSGAAMESSRRSSGAAMESSRRALGPAMEAERRGSGTQIADDIQRLGGVERKSTSLGSLESRGGIGGQSGVGIWSDPVSGGGGIASPLTEGDYTKREYWPDGILSSDGLFNMPALKTLVMTDNDGASVTVNFAKPVTPAQVP